LCHGSIQIGRGSWPGNIYRKDLLHAYVFIDLAAKLAGCGAQCTLKYSEYKIATFNMNNTLKPKIKYYGKFLIQYETNEF